MIDFRYHLVSLVSVFLALAVGIVLGAGPLKESISDTLTSQVGSLRAEKDVLRSELDTSQAAVAHRDEVLTSIAPSLVAGTLTGRSILLVSLPDADSAWIKPVTETLRAAGANIAARIELRTDWTDPGKEALRTELVRRLQAEVPRAGTLQGTQAKLAAVLAGVTLSPGPAPGPVGDGARQALDDLQSGRLISVDGDLQRPATAAVVLAPPVEQGSDGKPSPAPTPGASPYLQLVGQLDRASAGTVVLGPSSSALDGGLVAAIRQDSQVSSQVSTVDTGGTAMGVLACVFALREQFTGNAGGYGFGKGASDPMPKITGPL